MTSTLKNYWYVGAVVALIGMMVFTPTAEAIFGDWQIKCRNSDDTEHTDWGVPSFPTSTYGVLGQRHWGECVSSWYAFPEEYWEVTNGNGGGYLFGNNNYWVKPKASGISINELQNAHYYLLSTSTVQSWINNAVSPLQGDIYDLEWWNIQLINNLYGTSTTMSVESATTTNGLMSQAQSDKLASYPTYSTLLSTLGAQSDWSQASTTAPDFIKNKPTIPTITAQPKVNDAATNASTTAATNGATNAATNLTSDSVAILGINVPTNASYVSLVNAHNDLSTKYNALATKYNDAATKLNDAATKYNDASAKLNAIIDALEANGILTP